MKSKLLTSLFIIPCSIFFIQHSIAQSPGWLWAKAMGGTIDNSGLSIASDASGNVYTAGRFTGVIDFDPGVGTFNLTSNGLNDIFVSKLDSSGNFEWAKSIGGTGNDEGFSIALNIGGSGAVYTTGYFEGTVDFDPGLGVFNVTAGWYYDIFISKLDSAGNFIWAKAMGGTSDDVGSSIAVDVSGNVYTTGYFEGVVDFDPGPSGTFNLTSVGASIDIFISKLDNAGNFLWAKAMGGPGYNDVGSSIAIDPAGNGNVYTTGSFELTADFDPGVGTFNLTSVGSNDIFISKLDNSGNFIWAKAIGGTIGGQGFSIALGPVGSSDVYSTGNFWGTADFDPDSMGTFNLTSAGFNDIFISKLDSSGNFAWARAMGGISEDNSLSATLDDFGNIYTAGYFMGVADFDPDSTGNFNLASTGLRDIFISKLDSSGNFVWAKSMGGISEDSGLSVALGASGNVHLTGFFESPSISFDSITLTNAGGNNIFIARLGNTITGIENVENVNGISIFPNPATNKFTIYHSQFAIHEIVIYDLLGQKVFSGMSEAGSLEQTTINVSNFPEGVYIVQIQAEDFMETKKLIVAK